MDLSGHSYVVIGSGFSGAVLADRIASLLGQPVHVTEKRGQFGGNCFSADDLVTGIKQEPTGFHMDRNGQLGSSFPDRAIHKSRS
jgi:UDP-galactopyranose mutase